MIIDSERTVREMIKAIPDLNKEAMEEAAKRQWSLAKVPGSLGRLEDISVRVAGITGRVKDNPMNNQGIIIMCGDSGVVEEGVASAPQTVTLMQTINFTKGITGVSSQAKYFGIDLLVVDQGVKYPIPEEFLAKSPCEMVENGILEKRVVDRKLAEGTKNLLKEPAMDYSEAMKAIVVGIEAAYAMKEAGKNIFGVGEMGIGNTTPAAILICKLTGATPEEVVGRGGGLDDEGLRKKIEVVKEALEKYESLMPDRDSGSEQEGEPNSTTGKWSFDEIINFAAAVGSYEILGMTGAYIGAAAYGIPAVVDGYISIASALLAAELAPKVKDYLFTSHRSQEAGYRAAAEKLGIEPFFDLGMKLGEASGCPIAFKIIEASCAAMDNMATLEEGQIDYKYLEELREKGLFL